MPLRIQIPPASSSIHSCLQAIVTLLNSYTHQRLRFNRPFVPEVAAIADAISAGNVNIFEITARLEALVANHPITKATTLRGHIANIRAKLVTLFMSDGWGELIQATHNDPESVGIIIAAIQEAIKGLGPDQRYAILRQASNPSGWNALMAAVQHKPTAIDSILKAISGFSPAQQYEILSQVTVPGGRNALMIAARYQSRAIAPILKIMQGFSPAQQYKILSQVTSYDGWNALMYATFTHPEAVELLFVAMQDFSPIQKNVILSQFTISKGRNALMCAARFEPKVIGFILTLMQDLEPAQRDMILSRVTSFNGYNALMSAARYQSIAVGPILRAISPDHKYAILRQTSKSGGFNTLMCAVRYQPTVTELILESMQDLEPHQKYAILNQTTLFDDYNALMIAAYYNPDRVESILLAMRDFTPEQKANILLQAGTKGETVLQIMATHRNEHGPHPALDMVCKAIDTIYVPARDNSGITRNATGMVASASNNYHAFFSTESSLLDRIAEYFRKLTGLDGWVADDAIGSITVECEAQHTVVSELNQFADLLETDVSDNRIVSCSVTSVPKLMEALIAKNRFPELEERYEFRFPEQEKECEPVHYGKS